MTRILRRWRWIGAGMVLFLSLSFLLSLSPAIVAAPRRPATPKVQNLTPEKRYDILAKADELYEQGKKAEAEKLYRQVKPDFPKNPAFKDKDNIPEPVYEIEKLGGGERLWQNAQDGIAKGLDSKAFFGLQGLIKLYPQFVPSYFKLAEFCQARGQYCSEYGKDGQPKNAVEVLDRISEVYPSDPQIGKAKIKLLADSQNYLEASIAARQFALIYNDDPEAEEFSKSADEYLKKFEKETRSQARGNVLGTLLVTVANVAVSGDWQQAISPAKTLEMLLKGESSFGDAAKNQFASKFSSEGKLIEDEKTLDYIKGLAGRLTQFTGRKFEYEYFIVDDPDLNAFALPGGKVFINKGAILGTNSEAELAGLLGHEISHAVLSHGFQRATHDSLLGAVNENLGKDLPLVDYLSQITSKQYSRENETQADMMGTKILSAAGYASDGLRNFMATLNQKSGDRPTSLLDTHPAPADRITYLESLIQQNGYNRYAYEGVKKHREIQQRLNNLPAG